MEWENQWGARDREESSDLYHERWEIEDRYEKHREQGWKIVGKDLTAVERNFPDPIETIIASENVRRLSHLFYGIFILQHVVQTLLDNVRL